MINVGTEVRLPDRAYKSKWYRESHISVAILTPPVRRGPRISRGAMILNQVDPLVEQFPAIHELYFLIERRGWWGLNDSGYAHIKLVEDLSTWRETQRRFPHAILLNIGPADFVDCTEFRPEPGPPRFDVIQIASWSRRKRLDLMIEAATLLPKIRFLHLGFFECGGTADELTYRNECVALARQLGADIATPDLTYSSSIDMPSSKADINRIINKARIGLLTAASEGINRFKMECLASGRPMLVADDACFPTRKHICAQTGVFYPPAPDRLAEAVVDTLSRADSFAPREYVIASTGRSRSVQNLKEALRVMCSRTGDEYRFEEIDWDGRNQSLTWGREALRLLHEATDAWLR